MAAKKCKINIDTQNASEIISNKLMQWKLSYKYYFGHSLVSQQGLKKEIKLLTNTLAKLKRDLRNADDTTASGSIAKRQIEAAIKKIEGTVILGKQIRPGALSRRKEELKGSNYKRKLLDKIENLVLGQMNKYGDSALYDIDENVIYPVLKEWIQRQYTIPFKNLNDLDNGTLSSIYNKLNKIYTKQNRAVKKGLFTGTYPWLDKITHKFRNVAYDAGSVMFESDPTGLAADLVNKTRSAPDEAFSQAAPYKSILNAELATITNFIKNTKLLFNGAVNEAKSLENVVERIHDILDGQKRDIKFKSMFNYKNGKPVYSDDFKKDKKEFEAKLNRNIQNEINDGGDIQLIEINGKNHYYIPIKNVKNGVETWNAYEVPYIKNKQEGDSLEKSLRKSNKQIWYDFFDKQGLANSTNSKGRNFKSLIEDGWYSANAYVPLQGKKKGKKNSKEDPGKFQTQAYSVFERMESQENLDKIIWESIASIRSVLSSIRGNAVNKISEQEKMLKSIIRKIGIKNKNMSKKELDAAINNVLSIDMNLNFVIKDGNVVTLNNHYAEIDNYVPYMYSTTDIILGLINGRNALLNKIANEEGKLNTYKEKGNKSKVVSTKKSIKSKLELVEIFEEKINISLGLQDKDQASVMNTASLIDFAKHRSGFMSPLASTNKDGTVRTYGRRKDFGVFVEYTDQMFSQVNRNGLKVDLLNSMQGISKVSSDYLLDHAKRSMGRLDVEAGFVGLNYSDTRFAAFLTRLRKTFTNNPYVISPQTVYTAGKIQSMLISGGLLRWTSALTNQVQRLSIAIESGFKHAISSYRFVNNNPEVAREIADLAGTTDTVTALADSLLGAAGSDMTATSGWGNLNNLRILKMNKLKFVRMAKGNKWWKTNMSNLVERMGKTLDTDSQSYVNILEGVWEATHGLTDKTLNAYQQKALRKTLESIMTKDQINKYVGWALSGGLISQTSASKTLGFMQVEVDMRVHATIQGVEEAIAVGVVSQEEINQHLDDPYWAYKHPAAISYARLYVYNTMFGLSPAFLPKMFGGFWGTTLFKFKPYQWHQMRNEYRVITNWMNQQTDDGKSVSFIKDAILNPKSKLDKKIRTYFGTRIPISIITTCLWHIPLVGSPIKWALSFTNPQLGGAVKRGGESAIATSVLRSMMAFLAIGGSVVPGDEEDEIVKEWYRLYLPVYVNMMVDTISEGDPFKIVGLYNKTAHNIIKAITKELSD